MDILPATKKYKNHRFPGEIISHAVWLSLRFCLSFRDVEEILLEREVVVTYEAIRKWCRKFGQEYANQLRHRRPRPGDKWHLDEGAPRTHSQIAGVWCCTGDEGRPLGAGLQEQAPNRLKLQRSRAAVVSVEEKAGH
jgi:putative transposase